MSKRDLPEATCLFLTTIEKENIRNWKYIVEDQSIVSQLFNPFWNYIVNYVPETVAPNILSLAGLLCILYAHYLSNNYIHIYPTIISLASVLLVFIYMTLDAIDGKHARNIHNSTSLGELFDHSCDNIGLVFLILTYCHNIGITNIYMQWYLVQTAQLAFLNSHIMAFRMRIVKFGFFSGPGELLILYMGTIILNAFGKLDWLLYPLTYVLHILTFGGSVNIYCIVLAYTLYNIYCIEKTHIATKYGLLISIGASFIPSVLVFFRVMSEIDQFTVISHGLIMSVLTGDMIVSKMASRELHPLVPILVLLSLFDNFLCIIGCIIYYVGILSEISFSLRIPIFTVHYNVYCSGVFDLCHASHLSLFENAVSYGTNLIVGVHNDSDVESYKRRPTMTQTERVSVVAKSKYVNQVIPNAPLYLTREFINDHDIHIVVCSSEYADEDDLYYAVPRQMGILRVLPRSDGISTTDLLNRIKC